MYTKEIIIEMMHLYGYNGVVWKKRNDFFNGKKLEEIILNKEDYKDFIKSLKRTEGEISFANGASAGAEIRLFYREETAEIRREYGGFLDKLFS